MDTQQIYILMWTIANFFSFSTLSFMIIAILWNKEVRERKFNMYLIFSVLPDVIRNTLLFIWNIFNFIEFRMWSCAAIGWGDVYYTTANYWMGAVVLHEVHRLLLENRACTRSGQEMTSETTKAFYTKVAFVNAFAILMASIMLETSVDWIPDITLETQCEAFPRTTKESWYFWFVYVLPSMAVPTLYAFYLTFDTYKNNLLPLTGRTRAIALYFFRLIAIFVTFWIIFVIAVFLTGWAQAIAFVFYNLCGFFSFCFAVTKPDVKEAVVNLACICRPKTRAASTESSTSKTRHISTFRSSDSVVVESEEEKENESNKDPKTCHESFNTEGVEQC